MAFPLALGLFNADLLRPFLDSWRFLVLWSIVIITG